MLPQGQHAQKQIVLKRNVLVTGEAEDFADQEAVARACFLSASRCFTQAELALIQSVVSEFEALGINASHHFRVAGIEAAQRTAEGA